MAQGRAKDCLNIHFNFCAYQYTWWANDCMDRMFTLALFLFIRCNRWLCRHRAELLCNCLVYALRAAEKTRRRQSREPLIKSCVKLTVWHHFERWRRCKTNDSRNGHRLENTAVLPVYHATWSTRNGALCYCSLERTNFSDRLMEQVCHSAIDWNGEEEFLFVSMHTYTHTHTASQKWKHFWFNFDFSTVQWMEMRFRANAWLIGVRGRREMGKKNQTNKQFILRCVVAMIPCSLACPAKLGEAKEWSRKCFQLDSVDVKFALLAGMAWWRMDGWKISQWRFGMCECVRIVCIRRAAEPKERQANDWRWRVSRERAHAHAKHEIITECVHQLLIRIEINWLEAKYWLGRAVAVGASDG